MERLYLIRVDMERFLGPFTLRQLKDAHARMEFGLQDEVSGSLRHWVSFDDVENIRRHYPELAQMVQSDMLSGWGMSVPPQLQVGAGQRKARKKSSMPVIYRILILLLLALLGFIAYVYVQDGDLSSLSSPFKDRTFQTAQALYEETNKVQFEAFMDRNHELINRAMKKKKGLSQWLPYVRALAYSRDGRWEGLNAKRLRGKVDEELPQDCSMNHWEQIWTQSRVRWSAYLDGRELPQEEWALLLNLDPHSIRNRTPVSGWLNPGSYHEACLQMGLKALQRLSSQNTHWEAKVFISRLRWQLGVISGQALNEDFEMSGTLWALSCIEDSHDEAELRNCQSALSVKQSWKSLIDLTLVKRRLLLMLEDQQTLDEPKLAAFQVLFREFSSKLDKSVVSYADESKLFQEVIAQQGNIRQARLNMQQRAATSSQRSDP